MTLPLGVTPILGTACPTGWGKDGLCWPKCLQKGQLCLGASDLLAMTVNSQCPVGRGRDLAMDLDTFSLCVEGREALRGQGTASEKGQEQLPKSDLPLPYMTPKAELGLNVYKVKVVPSGRPVPVCSLKCTPSPLAPPPSATPLGSRSSIRSWRSRVCEGLVLLPWALTLHCWGWCVEKSRKVYVWRGSGHGGEVINSGGRQ